MKITDIRHAVRLYCAQIGKDALLVQGAGGNVSWKEGDALWIKASGTWLAHAAQDDIFVPLALTHLKHAIAERNFAVSPKVIGTINLRPSIETLLHALMPQRIVLHLHAIAPLVQLVRANCHEYFHAALSQAYAKNINSVLVDYHQPGPALALALADIITRVPAVNVFFLRNHGVVIGGDSIDEVHNILDTIINICAREPLIVQIEQAIKDPPVIAAQYRAVPDCGVQQLACCPELLIRLKSAWALYPDHVVFLGPHAHVYASWDECISAAQHCGKWPGLVFIAGEGVYAKRSWLTVAHQVQLRCYFEVLVRQEQDDVLVVLTDQEIAALLHWDAEQYRMNLVR